MAIPDYALWLAIFLFYCSEQIKLEKSARAWISISAFGRVRLSLSRSPYMFLGRELYIIAPFIFFRNYFSSPFSPENLSRRSGLWELRRIRLLSKLLSPYNIFEAVLASFYFLLCPTLTLIFSISWIIIAVIIMHISGIIFSSIFIYKSARSFHLKKSQVASLIAEICLSPGLMMAISRRLTTKLQKPVLSDGPLIVYKNLSDADRSEMISNIKFRLEDMIEYSEIDDASAAAYMRILGGYE